MKCGCLDKVEGKGLDWLSRITLSVNCVGYIGGSRGVGWTSFEGRHLEGLII